VHISMINISQSYSRVKCTRRNHNKANTMQCDRIWWQR